jgi:hypothetical protein
MRMAGRLGLLGYVGRPGLCLQGALRRMSLTALRWILGEGSTTSSITAKHHSMDSGYRSAAAMKYLYSSLGSCRMNVMSSEQATRSITVPGTLVMC